jgi:hypothetical protein
MELTMNKYLKRLQDFDNRWWFTGYHLDFLLLDFEVAPLEYQIQVTHDEAIMYCFSLNIDGKTGWRLPTFEEIGAAGLFYGNVIIMHYSNSELGWKPDRVYPVRPVRDIVKYTTTRKLLCKLLNSVYSKKS